MKIKRFAGSLLLAVPVALAAVIIYAAFDKKEQTVIVEETPRMQYVSLPAPDSDAPASFEVAAENAVDAVVHVKTKSVRESSGNPFYDLFFGYQDSEPAPVLGYGSGVILTSDGYIVTNNHVIEGSQEVEVILNDRRAFDAEVIGTDPSTDLAVLKINGDDDFSFLSLGNSDNLRLGEWVLAVGNPYNLTSTVTAGIVSAKARSIDILVDEPLAIESFIQTDAAVNPGNSGGALVNTRGELVGINSAIASRTGAFSGYSFAIPVSIVRKVTEDLIEYGAVQRALIGVTIEDLTAENAGQYNIDRIEGVLITGIRENGAAKEADIRAYDVIVAINGVKVNSPAELQDQVNRYRPKDRISVTLRRGNKTLQKDVVLRNPAGGTGIVEKEEIISALGASFEDLSPSEMRELGVRNGIRVVDIKGGKFRSSGIREGFIILQVNNVPVKDVEDFERILESSGEGIYVEGTYPDGLIAYYAIRL